MPWRAAPILVVLVALPVTGLIASTDFAGPVAKAEDAPGRLLPSDGGASPRRSAPASPAASSTRAGAAAPSRARVAQPPAPAKATPGASIWAGRIPDRGSGKFRTAKVDGPVVGKRGKLLRYTVRIERELPFEPDSTARLVQAVLSDRRSWVGSGDWRMQLVADARRADFSVLVATPKTTDTYCLPLRTWGRLSCQDGPRAVLNARRWAFGADSYGKNVAGYRTYLVNHEVGHVLGFGHRGCPKKGARAPVMLQQTKGLQGCRPNVWPSAGR